MITEFEIPRTHVQYEPGFQLVLPLRSAMAGSCFSAKIASYLRFAGADVLENPTGIVYNPVSLEQAICHAVLNEPYTEKDFFEYNGLFHGYEHHGIFSQKTLAETLNAAEKSRKDFGVYLKTCELAVITFGTAVVWESRQTGRLMANCHKVPADHFVRRILSVSEIERSVRRTTEMLRKHNPQCRIVLTISPVRHHPGDPMLNARSKAHLLAAVRMVTDDYPEIDYFPAYEIMTDELRDYRFYGADLVHPSEEAAQLISAFFFRAYFGKNGDSLFAAALRESKRYQHIPIRKEV